MDVRHYKPAPVIADPRQYQVEILNLAITKNIIAYLGTGTGKTLIAVLLIKHVFEQEKEMIHHQLQLGTIVHPKLCFFLVTTVPLVFQQSGVIQSNLMLRIGKYCGEMGVDYWKAEKWAEELGSHDVIVCTAKIMENLLHYAYVTMDKVNLIIFDECHNAVGNSPYNTIMKNFYFTTPVERRPKILGLTASPINSGLEYNEAKINKILIALEKTLDSEVVTVNNTEELLQYAPVAQEDLCEYDPCPTLGEITNRLEGLLSGCASLWLMVGVILDYVGVWGLYYYFSQSERFDLSSIGLDVDCVPVVLELCRQYLSHPTGDTIDPATDLSTKLQSLVALLQRSHDETPSGQKFCGIVFVKRRLIATMVNAAIAKIPDLHGIIASACLVGHGGRETKDGKPDLEGKIGMNFKDQCGIIGRFRKHELNVLISTSLLEEGLDVPICRLVVRYDIPDTLISHVQSRGRARHQNSKYIISVEKNNPITTRFIEQLKKMEASMRSLRAQGRIANGTEDEPDEVIPIQFVVPSTRAVLTYPSSYEKIYQFCQTLPSDQFSRHIPIFELILASSQGYQYVLTLPANCPVRLFEGKVHYKKKTAKQSVAYVACIQLYEMGLLDEHLLPPRPQKQFKLQDPNSKVGSKKSVREYNAEWPAIFKPLLTLADPQTVLHLTEIAISGGTASETTFGILTRSKVPLLEFPVKIAGEARSTKFSTTSTLTISSEQYICAHHFHRILFTHLFRSSLFEPSFAKETDFQLPYIVVPLIDSKSVDWPAVSRACVPMQTAQELLAQGKSLENLAIIHTIEYQRKYFVEEVRTDLNPTSPLSSSKKNRSVDDKMSRRFNTQCNPNQPILKVSKLPNPTTVINPLHTPSKNPRARCMPYVAPQFCHILPFHLQLYISSLVLPSILQHMEYCVGAREFASALNLPVPDHPMWIQALMCSNIDSQNNYQRLEFLGDSVLKYILSKHLFLTNPNMHEGWLSQARAHLCCNHFLFERAIEKQLFSYIANTPFNHRGWYPNKPRKAQLSDKTIADCVESTLGACFVLAKGTQAQVLLATQTAMSFGFPLQLDYSQEFSIIMSLRANPEYSPLIDFAHNVLGYHFANLHLLIASLTHTSMLNTSSGSYQRLEFLGDAIIDLLVVRHLYDKYPNIDPGALTLLKLTLVSNKTFSLLAYFYNFHKHIEHNSTALLANFASLSKYMQGELLEKELTLEDISTLVEDPECEPPKILSDVFEAITGAIYLDCNMNIDIVWQVMCKFIVPFMDKCVHPGSHQHPTSKLTQMCQQVGCSKFSIGPDGENCWTVKIHDQVITSIQGKNKKTAKVMAAKNAVTILEANAAFLQQICDCRIDPPETVVV